jgi:hypothetical protein
MNKLPYLVAEINAALEVYLSGRTGQQYDRVAFILCDDAAELASKLLLLVDTSRWSDMKTNGHFKNVKDITHEVRALFSAKRAGDYAVIDALLKRIEGRRNRRNEFFHSTSLLDLNFHSRDCIEAFCDLLDYGRLLFPSDWQNAVAAAGNMETCEAIIRLDKKGYGDPSIFPKVNAILGNWPRRGPSPKTKGCEVAHHAEDMHLRLAIRNGGKELRDRLLVLL